uniref:Uncharacterized protein n=1 Tax=Romanomermis culicivorax TaxID=13658 RepID=A0A915JEC2_ROMCU
MKRLPQHWSPLTVHQTRQWRDVESGHSKHINYELLQKESTFPIAPLDQLNPHKPSSWLAYLIDNSRDELPLCFVSLISRTPGQKAESTDLLITLANCVMRETENGLEEVNANDLWVKFLHLNSSGVPDQEFKHAIAQVLYEDGGKSAKDRVALLRMDEN